MTVQNSLKKRILAISREIYNTLEPGFPVEWLKSDLTVAQMRVLLLLHQSGECRMGELAQAMEVALSTATGIVDNLIAKELVKRQVSCRDRRIVLLSLSIKGRTLTEKLFYFSRVQIERLMHGLDVGQLTQVLDMVEMLRVNLVNNQDPDRKPGI
jgi:DNA-binding MarR family transcriptional regulator